MRRELPDFQVRAKQQQKEMGEEGALRLLHAARKWNLAPVLEAGGTVIFPHATLAVCGVQIAAAVHACLDSKAHKVLALGVLHARTAELEQARVRVANGAEVTQEPTRGIQGPDLVGRQEWREEFSLSHFRTLWEVETKRRGIVGPELILRYPYLVGSQPERLPGIADLQEIVRDGVVVVTMDGFHHGIGYGELPEKALMPEAGGLELARLQIMKGLELLSQGDYRGYNQHCVETKSDGRDVGQVFRHLLGPFEARMLDLVADDMTEAYSATAPTWVAGALIALEPQTDRVRHR